MILWIFSHIAWWWWLGLVGCVVLCREIGWFTGIMLWISMTIGAFCLYGLWSLTLGLFFDSVWDLPWWCWLLLLAGGAGTATTTITHGSNERVSSVTITKK